jgi:hypothetical protein
MIIIMAESVEGKWQWQWHGSEDFPSQCTKTVQQPGPLGTGEKTLSGDEQRRNLWAHFPLRSQEPTEPILSIPKLLGNGQRATSNEQ